MTAPSLRKKRRVERRGLLDWLDAPVTERGIHQYDRTGEEWPLVPYSEIARGAGRVANALTDAGVPAGSAVVLISGSAPEFVAGFMGCLAAGCTPAPAATPLTFGDPGGYAQHLRLLRRAADAPAAVVEAALLETVTGAFAEDPDRPQILDLSGTVASASIPSEITERRPLPATCLLQFTSGSTGTPKGVVVSRDALESNIQAITAWGEWYDDADAMGSWLPPYHDMGLIGTLLLPTVAQRDIWYLQPFDFIRQPDLWLDCFGRGRSTITAAPTFGYAYAASRVPAERWEEWDFETWRIAIVAAERVDLAALRKFAERAGPRGFSAGAFAPAYGLAESTLAVTMARLGEVPPAVKVADLTHAIGAPVSIEARTDVASAVGDREWMVGCGKPLEGIEVWVAGSDDRPLPEGVLGEIRVAGSSLADAYQLAPEDKLPLDPAGHATGDAGFVDRGELYVLGRLGDSLSVEGRNVFAEDLDAKIGGEAGIRHGRCAVALGSTATEHVCAVLVDEDEDVAPAAIAAVARSATGGGVRILVAAVSRRDIPRTSSGKPRRFEIFRRFTSGLLDEAIKLDLSPADRR